MGPITVGQSREHEKTREILKQLEIRQSEGKRKEMDAKKQSHTCQCVSLHSEAGKTSQDRQSVDKLKTGR